MSVSEKTVHVLHALDKTPRHSSKKKKSDLPGEPLPLLRDPEKPEDFPLDCIGPTMAAAVKVIADTIKAPTEICAQSALAAASLISQGLYDVKIDGRQSPSSCFFLTIAGSGDRKSAADTVVLKAIREVERQKILRHQREMLEFQMRSQVYEAAKSRVLRQKKQKSIEVLNKEIAALGEPPKAPPSPIMLLQEPTYEGLTKHFAFGWPSVGLFSDEGGRLIGGHALNQENQLKTASGFSETWDGKPTTRSRAGDGTCKLYGRRLAAHLMVQPNVAGLFLGNGLFVGQGLTARFLICHPTSQAGNREYCPTDCTEATEVRALYKRHEELLQRGLNFAGEGSLEIRPAVLELSDEAKELFREVYDSFESKLAKNGAYANIASFASKGPEHALRLAAVIHCIESDEFQISSSTLKNAATLVHWYAGECLRLWGTTTDSQELILAQATLDWLKNTRRHKVKLQDLYQKGPKGIRSAETSKHIVQILTDHGHLRPVISTAEHGLASTEWEVISV